MSDQLESHPADLLAIDVSHLDFAYNGEGALHDVELKVEQGERSVHPLLPPFLPRHSSIEIGSHPELSLQLNASSPCTEEPFIFALLPGFSSSEPTEVRIELIRLFPPSLLLCPPLPSHLPELALLQQSTYLAH